MFILRSLLFLLGIALLVHVTGTPVATAQQIGFIERYALAKDREAVLAELIPGSEDHFYYHCLHYQVTGQIEKAEALLASWKNTPLVAGSGYLQSIEDRQRLLAYGLSPDRSVDYFRNRLGVRLDHRAPVTPGVRRFPSQLDQALIGSDRWVTSNEVANNQLTRAGIRHLAKRLIAQGLNDASQLRHVLQRVDGPWLEELDRLVIAELKLRRPEERAFGDFPAHSFLTLDALRRVATEVAEVAASSAMVSEVLARLRPSDDVDMTQQPEVRAIYLKQLDEYVSSLPEAFNGLKAATLYQLLQSDVAAGRPNRQTFIRYLRLPRMSPLVPEPLPIIGTRLGTANKIAPGQPIDLALDYTNIALVPPIGNEEPLVRSLLEYFLKTDPTTAAFDGLLKPEYLSQVFAESKLLAGVAPADRWYAMLGSARAQQLRERVELTLAPDNPLRHDPTAETTLKVDIKNVDSLVIRIYKINTESFYRTRDRAIDTDIDLDALVPTIERQVAYSQDAVARHRENLQLEEITGRGVWIVDLLGGGLRARALIRRGDLRAVVTPSADGLRVTAVNEHRQPVAGARMILTGREVVADENGSLTLPPADVASNRKVILSDQELAVPIQIEQPAEDYALTAGMFIDRQQVQSGEMTDLIIRPRLTMIGNPVDPHMLKDVALVLVATDLDGISTTRRFGDLKLNQAEELVVSLRVPPRVVSLSATLSASIDSISTNQTRSVQAVENWNLASIRRTSLTQDTHLTRSGDQWIVEVLGLSGEPIVGAMVTVTMTSSLRSEPIRANLQSDDAGRVSLGPLNGVDSLVIESSSGSRAHDLKMPESVWPESTHSVVGQDLRVPLPSLATAIDGRFRLLGLRSGRPASDLSDKLSLAGGQVIAAGLEAGNYQLWDLESDNSILIAVTDGPLIDHVAIGVVRSLQIPVGDHVGIDSVQKTDQGLKVQLAGTGPLTRVHVIAGRYHTHNDPFQDLRLPAQSLQTERIWNPTSGYLSDLRLGDEYRYVMRRKYATKYPGVMLPQPGLILNPWETETTENQSQSVSEGDAMMPAAPSPSSAAKRQADDRLRRSDSSETAADYDFLADSGFTLTNLRPNADGVIVIPADVVASMPLIQIIVSDPVSLVRRTFFAPLEDLPARDLRLAEAIPAERHYAFVRGIVTASPTQPLDLKSLGSAQIQVYSSVGDLLDLYMTIVADPRMNEFRQIGQWHTLNDGQKQEWYGRLASHELHLFLSRHDRPFFDSVIKPYLLHKKEKQFVDHYLLDNDLSSWTQPWRYAELNAGERAILARQVPEVRDAVLREFREITSLVDDEAGLSRRLIDMALAGRSLESQRDSFAMELADKRDRDASASAPPGRAIVSGEAFGLGVTNAAAADVAESRLLRRKSAEKMQQQAPGRSERELAEGMLGMRADKSRLPFFQQLDSTKQWAESHWDRIRVRDAAPDLIAIDPFWIDVILAENGGPEISEHLLRPSSNRHAALVALAFCGLPLIPEEVKLPSADEPLVPPHAVAVITKRLSELRSDDREKQNEGSILVGQRFERVHAETATPKRKTAVAVAPDEFIVGTAYRGQVILTNPTPMSRVVDVLWQIPAGSLPLAGGLATDSRTITLQPFQVEKIDYEFYFPLPGNFVHYPVCVAADGMLAGRASERLFNVLQAPSKIDEASWQSVAENGTAEQIRSFLATANLQEIDWSHVLHRLTDRKVYDILSNVMTEFKISNAAIRGYALHHRDTSGMNALFSEQEDLVQSVGPVFRSDLLVVDPIERQFYEQLEYAPLVVARIHPLRAENEILNATFLGQFRNLLKGIAYSPKIDDHQKLSLTYYLLLQNRIEDALSTFATVDAKNIDTKLQHSYLTGYLALHRGDYEIAEKIAAASVQHPVPRWRARFTTLAEQLRQRRQWTSGSQQVVNTDGGSKTDQGLTSAIPSDAADLSLIDREKRGENAAESEPSVEVIVNGRTLRITHRNADSAVLNLYAVDPELLFSKTPFVRSDLSSMAMVEPTQTQTIRLATVESADGNRGVTDVLLDENLSRQTLMVEVVAGPARSTTLYYGGNLTAYVSDGFGQVQVTDTASGRPVATAYVKVYARHNGGEVKFYKDGYTDLRGRFDYASISTGDLATVERFAILVIDPERGATIREAGRPQ